LGKRKFERQQGANVTGVTNNRNAIDELGEEGKVSITNSELFLLFVGMYLLNSV
jgi:hypothetical protein